MSIASILEQQREDALDVVHGDDLTLQPEDISVRGYAQELEIAERERGAKPNPMIRVGDKLATHIIHIRRSLLAGVVLADQNTIEDEGSGKVYRVLEVKDEPTRATVTFFCML